MERLFDYVTDEPVDPGTLVHAPFGARHLMGCVWRQGIGDRHLKAQQIKRADAISGDVRFAPSFLTFIDWMAEWTCIPRGLILKAALAPGAGRPGHMSAKLSAPAITHLSRCLNDAARDIGRLSRKRLQVWDILDSGSMPPSLLRQRAQCSDSVLRGMVDGGWLRKIKVKERWDTVNPDFSTPCLSADQKRAADALSASVDKGGFRVTFLDGVTGSGKTMVYFEAIASVVGQGHQALVLVPEIALSEQWLKAFKQRFGTTALAWHSSLSPASRRRCWHAAANGDFPVIVGARSALFLPFRRLRLIVVDEEHDATFKQEDGLVYHARDMAIARARSEGAGVILSSATPSLETFNNVKQGKFAHVVLPSRFKNIALPKVELVDMRKQSDMGQRWISPSLEKRMGETLRKGLQSLLFLNRRGYAPLMICSSCGYRFQGDPCGNAFVYHRRDDTLLCHHCGIQKPLPEQCPSCHQERPFRPCGPGVERLFEETVRLFPDARCCIISSDCGRDALMELLDRIAHNAYDIVIGTQIIAKGHHFPHLHLVGVVDADFGLSGGDLRAAEKTFQILHQVTGRAGRGQKQGQAVIQTYDKDAAVMQALVSGDRETFLDEESDLRKRWQLPPHGRLAALIVSGTNRERTLSVVQNLARAVPIVDGIRVLGPAPAPLFIVRGRYRWRFLIKAGINVRLSGFMHHWSRSHTKDKDVRLLIDIDPFNFL